ncbi:MAG: gamma-glutamyl-gamma-aminobutyrate hydrolase family protein [Candidatus Acidiferrales bacterium]
MSAGENHKPRVGVPYRTKKEELTDEGRKIEPYLQAVRVGGGEPVAISLALTPQELESLAATLDALLLPGSPADVDPSLFHRPRHPECEDADPDRERTDFFLLDHAFRQKKPVLAICFGIQSLNVFLGGSLVQDIASELHSPIQHDWDREHGAPEPFHGARIEPGSRLAEMAAGAGEARVNSSHHQAILDPGRNLRVVARAPDGVIEAVEMAGDSAWVMGVQWHPERMAETDLLARALFRELVAAARQAPTRA